MFSPNFFNGKQVKKKAKNCSKKIRKGGNGKAKDKNQPKDVRWFSNYLFLRKPEQKCPRKRAACCLVANAFLVDWS